MRNLLLVILLFVWVAPASSAIQWDHDSPLTVQETITLLNGGLWRYEYSFVNTETSPIISFGLYTRIPWSDYSGFRDRLLYGFYTTTIDDVPPVCDARNLDPQIIRRGTCTSCTQNHLGDIICIEEQMIQPGELAAGLAYTSTIYDPLPKYYYYETLESGHAMQSGVVGAVGQTVPEPTTLLLIAFGGLGLAGRHRYGITKDARIKGGPVHF